MSLPAWRRRTWTEVPLQVEHLRNFGLVVHVPLPITVGGLKLLVEGVEGLDERLAVLVLAVLRAGVPEPGVGIHDELAVLHVASLPKDVI